MFFEFMFSFLFIFFGWPVIILANVLDVDASSWTVSYPYLNTAGLVIGALFLMIAWVAMFFSYLGKVIEG